VPEESQLPVDPSSDAPNGFREAERGLPGGFIGDPDVLDTWATSSLTPQIVGGWETDPDRWARVFPFDLRPQGHDIIRTWLFATVVRAHLENDDLPWKHAAISGWILDPDRKKMSKSKGNVVTPIDLLEEHGSDAVRYWAASGRPGTDTAFDVGQMKIGRRLAIKVLNASRFALSMGAVTEGALVTNALDKSMLAQLAEVVRQATAAFEGYNYSRALEVTEKFYWRFCDDYVELVKDRVYGGMGDEAAASAKLALGVATDTLLRLFAPFLPFVTEEVWSWWRDGSVHRASWPTADSIAARAGDGDPAAFDAVADVLVFVRKAKSDAKKSMRVHLASATLSATSELIAQVKTVEADLRAAGGIDELVYVEAERLHVTAVLAETE
jgi:valyl-tRNA synthetase